MMTAIPFRVASFDPVCIIMLLFLLKFPYLRQLVWEKPVATDIQMDWWQPAYIPDSYI